MKILIYTHLNNMNAINFRFTTSAWPLYCENRLPGLSKAIASLVCIFSTLLFVDRLNMYETALAVKSSNHKYASKLGVALMKQLSYRPSVCCRCSRKRNQVSVPVSEIKAVHEGRTNESSRQHGVMAFGADVIVLIKCFPKAFRLQ